MKAYALGLVSGLALMVATTFAQDTPEKVADENRERVEAEAMSQAAEADRLFKAGEFASALPLYEAERGSRAALGDERYEAYALRAIGCCRYGLGNDDAAIAAWQRARKLDAHRDDSGFEGYDWFLIGQAHLRRGRTVDSEKALKLALPLLSKAIDRDHEADARLVMADVLMRLDRPDEVPGISTAPSPWRATSTTPADWPWPGSRRPGSPSHRESLAWPRNGPTMLAGPSRHRGPGAESALASRALGEALADLDRLDAAPSPLNDAIRVTKPLTIPPPLPTTWPSWRPSTPTRATCRRIAVARRAVQARRAANDPAGEIDALVSLASYQDQAGHEPDSAATLAAAVEIARREATPARLVHLLVLSASVTRRAGHPNAADALLDEAERSAQAADNAALKRIVFEARASAAKPGR